jgi:hypothetical protein
MKANRTMAWALASGAVVILLSSGVAYLTTGILDSSTSGKLRGWSLEGGIAAFGFTFLLLSNLIFQLYKEMSRERAEDYLKQIQELQSKLIRGAPQPEGYLIDIDEHHKLVFARPEKWVPNGGLLYQYVAPEATRTDLVPASFNVYFETAKDLERAYDISPRELGRKSGLSASGLEELYGKVIRGLREWFPKIVEGYSLEGLAQEYLLVDGLKSVRYTHTYSKILPTPPPPSPAPSASAEPAEDAGPVEPVTATITQVGIAIYQPRRAVMFTFTFTDDAEDFLSSSEDFNRIVSSIRFL